MSTENSTSGRGVFVVGASGGVGKQLLRQLRERGHRVSGMHRGDDAGPITDAGADPVHGDLVEDSADDLAALMRGHDAVVFSAGGGVEIDRDGAQKAIDAATAAGVRRFVLVSVFMDAWRGDESPGEGFEQYMVAKRAADVHLGATELDFVIIRPGTLSDGDGTGSVTAGISVAYGEIPREDVAAFITAALFSPLNRIAVEVTGGSRPVQAAVDALSAPAYTA